MFLIMSRQLLCKITRMLLKSVSRILVPANLKRTIRWHCSHDSISAALLETLRHSVFLFISFMFYFKHYCFITFQCVWCFQCVVGGWVFYFLFSSPSPPLLQAKRNHTYKKPLRSSSSNVIHCRTASEMQLSLYYHNFSHIPTFK